jgi:DivIVA domain-containing protein
MVMASLALLGGILAGWATDDAGTAALVSALGVLIAAWSARPTPGAFVAPARSRGSVPAALRGAQFRAELGGYRPADVDAVLELLAHHAERAGGVRATDVRDVRFRRSLRGYDRAEVEQLLDDVVDPHAG